VKSMIVLFSLTLLLSATDEPSQRLYQRHWERMTRRIDSQLRELRRIAKDSWIRWRACAQGEEAIS